MTKPRYDGKGSQFGKLHRFLDPSICMLDLDGLDIVVTQHISLRGEDTCYIEYRHNNEEIEIKAVIELKPGFYSGIFELDGFKNSVNRARLAIARKLECRLLVVIQNKINMDIYEIDTSTGEHKKIYSLPIFEEADQQRKAIRECWEAIGLNIKFDHKKAISNSQYKLSSAQDNENDLFNNQ